MHVCVFCTNRRADGGVTGPRRSLFAGEAGEKACLLLGEKKVNEEKKASD